MKQDLKDKWVAALRSGKYHQTKHVLCKVEGNQTFHCCLGVLCRVALKEGMNIKKETRHDYGGTTVIQFDNNVEELSNHLLNKFRLNPVDAENLVRMNDEDHSSFREIADFIESEIK